MVRIGTRRHSPWKKAHKRPSAWVPEAVAYSTP